MSRSRDDRGGGGSGGTKIYVGNLPPDYRDSDLERLFEKFGKVASAHMKTSPGGRSGYGFVDFEDNRDMQDAVKEMNNKELEGQRILVEPKMGGSGRGRDRSPGRGGDDRGRRTGTTLYVGNVAERATEADLRDEFSRVGRLREVRMGFRKSADGRQHAFIDFEDPRDAEEAYRKYRDFNLMGMRLRVDFDDGPGRGGRSNRFQPYRGGGGGGGSRYDDRDRDRDRDRRSRDRDRDRDRDRSGSRRRSRRSGSR